MRNSTAIITTLVLTLLSTTAGAQEQNKESTQSSSEDSRIFVDMPAQARGYMRQDMLDHLIALNEIIGLLASDDLPALAEIAETRIGRSSMGKYRGTGMGPGRFMPLEMRNIGWSMHDAATELAVLAKKGDKAATVKALQKLTTSCVVCHNSYRTR